MSELPDTNPKPRKLFLFRLRKVENAAGSDVLAPPSPSNHAEGDTQLEVPANGANGEKQKKREGFHDARGRFTLGNPGGPGNPRARHTAMIRRAFTQAASAEDVSRIVDVVLKDAKAGDAPSAREALRCLGVKQVNVTCVTEPDWRTHAVPPRQTVTLKGPKGCEEVPFEYFIKRYVSKPPVCG